MLLQSIAPSRLFLSTSAMQSWPTSVRPHTGILGLFKSFCGPCRVVHFLEKEVLSRHVSSCLRLTCSSFPHDGGPAYEKTLEEDEVFRNALYGLEEQHEIESDGTLGEDDFSEELLSFFLGTGTWRLGDNMSRPFEALASQIETAWRGTMESDEEFGVYPLPLKYTFWDSEDATGIGSTEKEGQSLRLQIENRAYQSRVFRKMHIELAYREDGLEVLHVVLYPRTQFDVPILSLDMVGVAGKLRLAIIDPCPVSADTSLPQLWQTGTEALQKQYGVQSSRTLPDWGSDIFSPLCICSKPGTREDVVRFVRYAASLNAMHMKLALVVEPVKERERRMSIHKAHMKYVEKQQENDRTFLVLKKAFGAEASSEYMRTVMFDCPSLDD